MEFSVGDKVLSRNTERARSKFGQRYEGPFIVQSKQRDIYKLVSLDGKQHRTRHVKNLKKWLGDSPTEQQDATSEVELVNCVVNQASGSVKSVKLIVLLSLMAVVCGQAKIFDRAAPIVWTQLPNYVDNGVTKFHIEMNFGNPCIGLRGIRVMQNQILSVQKAENHCSSLYDNLINMPIAELHKVARTMESTKANPFEHAASIKEKRMIAEVLCGVFFFNIVSTFVEKIWTNKDDTDMRERQRAAAEKLTTLIREMNATKLVESAVQDNLNQMHEVLRRTNERLNLIAIEAPDVAVTSSYLVGGMMIKSSLLGKLKYSYRN